MKKSILATAMLLTVLVSSTAFADKNDQMIIQEAAKNRVNVQQVAQLKDATGVTLMGQITRHIKSDHYELKDQSGSIGLEIDDDLWRAAGLTVGDHVRVVGEVDTHRHKPTDIEVVKIEKIHH